MDENKTSGRAVLVEEVWSNLSEKEKKNWEGYIKSSPIGLRHSWAALGERHIPLFLCNALSTFHSNRALPVTPTLSGHLKKKKKTWYKYSRHLKSTVTIYKS